MAKGTLYMWGQVRAGEPAWSLGEWDASMHEDNALADLKREFFALWLTTSKKSPLHHPETITERVK
jgi:hypothetical protein